MAIKVCPSCGGRGCNKCRDGFIDLEVPIKKAISLPSRQQIEELVAKVNSFEEFKSLLGNEFGGQFAIAYALDLWKEVIR